MEQENLLQNQSGNANRIKIIIAGTLIVAAIAFLIISSTKAGAQYFLTVDELSTRGANMIGKDIRVSGAVIGDTIQYDANTLTLSFDVAHVPGDNKEIEAQGGLAVVLHNAVTDPNRKTLHIVYEGIKPDLLRNEAQAIMSGRLGEDGIFYADELLLKCPTKYEEAIPQQVDG
ncbi:MAG: cytochrome c maturation protein CcmE [Chloroflexi bacterium]|nr:cytochrome c maturation protein CcmE [Chloroflexota bacterium]